LFGFQTAAMHRMMEERESEFLNEDTNDWPTVEFLGSPSVLLTNLKPDPNSGLCSNPTRFPSPLLSVRSWCALTVPFSHGLTHAAVRCNVKKTAEDKIKSVVRNAIHFVVISNV
jgi:hypothetical protein